MDNQCCDPEDPCPESCAPPQQDVCCYEEVTEDVCDDDKSSSKKSKKRRKRRDDDDDDDRSSKRSKESRQRRQSLDSEPPPYIVPQPMRPSIQTDQAIMKKESKGLFQFDIIALLIILTWIFALVVVIMAAFYYQADSEWNEIVYVKKALPTISDETLFSGKYIYMYDKEPKLHHAKIHMLREDRAVEIVHLIFFSLFLALTLVQFIMYVTRGNNDHTKILVIYYGVFGGLGLIISIFPYISWSQLDVNYRAASKKLQEFSKAQYKTTRSQWKDGVTHSTAFDANVISQVLEFCAGQSHYGLFDQDKRYTDFFGRDYNIHDFHALGFCAHQKCRVTTALMGYIFATLCCAIPCVACIFGLTSKVTDSTAIEIQKQRTSSQPQALMQQAPRQSLPPPPTQYYDDDGNPLTEQQMKVIEKFRRYVLTDTKD